MIRRKANNQDFLDILGISSTSKEVLLDIVNHGVSSVADISTRLGLPKSTVYDAVVPLLDQSLINEYSNERGKTFGISDNEQLAEVHKLKLEQLGEAYAILLSFIRDHRQTDSMAKPKIKFYSGIQGIRQAFRDMAWSKDLPDAYLMWPMKDMLDSVGEEFFKWHSSQRIPHKVIVNSIQRHTDRSLQSPKHDWLLSNMQLKYRRVRYLPKGVDWKMSFWLYGNKCLFASGGTEKIAFTIHSKEFAQLMKLLWQSMWNVAKV